MITNNHKLKQIQAAHNLTNKAVSDLLGCSKAAIDSWSCNVRNMPDISLAYLKHLLKEGET